MRRATYGPIDGEPAAAAAAADPGRLAQAIDELFAERQAHAARIEAMSSDAAVVTEAHMFAVAVQARRDTYEKVIGAMARHLSAELVAWALVRAGADLDVLDAATAAATAAEVAASTSANLVPAADLDFDLERPARAEG